MEAERDPSLRAEIRAVQFEERINGSEECMRQHSQGEARGSTGEVGRGAKEPAAGSGPWLHECGGGQ